MRHRVPLPRLLVESDIRVVSPSNQNRTSGPGNAGGDFDTNMVIILAALLGALICALGINSIVRCMLRCSRRFGFLTTASSSGLKKDSLSGIPEVGYKSGLTNQATDCPICLGEFMEGEKVRVLPRCSHGFHVKCIDRWLESHSSCPTCRQQLP